MMRRIAAGIGAALLLWVAASYLDIISDNIAPEPKHADINAFVILAEIMEGETE